MEGAVACMQPVSGHVSADAKALADKSAGKSAGGKKYSEIWAMYMVGESRIKIITAWRYPGKSPERDPIPQNIIREIRQLLGV